MDEEGDFRRGRRGWHTRLSHFEECLARSACVGLVAHVTHVGDAAEIPLAVHSTKSTCRRWGSPIIIKSEFEYPVFDSKSYFK